LLQLQKAVDFSFEAVSHAEIVSRAGRMRPRAVAATSPYSCQPATTRVDRQWRRREVSRLCGQLKSYRAKRAAGSRTFNRDEAPVAAMERSCGSEPPVGVLLPAGVTGWRPLSGIRHCASQRGSGRRLRISEIGVLGHSTNASTRNRRPSADTSYSNEVPPCTAPVNGMENNGTGWPIETS